MLRVGKWVNGGTEEPDIKNWLKKRKSEING